MDDPVLHPATRVVHLGRPPREPGTPVSPPVVLTSTYAADGPVDYARHANPTWAGVASRRSATRATVSTITRSESG